MTTAGAGGCRGEASAPVPAAPPPGAVVGSAAPRRILPPTAAAPPEPSMTSSFKLDFLPEMMVDGRLLVSDRM